MKEILLYIWQLPQNLLGLLIIFLYKASKINRGEKSYYTSNKVNFGVSLGNYRIMKINCSEKTIDHEYGHTIQSRYLGWFYLLIIGLPSAIGNILHRFIRFNYYSQPWEKWADKLGGVNR